MNERLCAKGRRMKDADARRLFDSLDDNGDGVINFAEFIKDTSLIEPLFD